MEISISGWRFADQNANSQILSKKVVFSMLILRECNSRRPKQESYHRSSRAVVASGDEYKDYNSTIYYVSIRDFPTLICIRAKLLICKN